MLALDALLLGALVIGSSLYVDSVVGFLQQRLELGPLSARVVLALAAVYCAFFVYAAGGVDLKVDYSFFKTSRPSDSTRIPVRRSTLRWPRRSSCSSR